MKSTKSIVVALLLSTCNGVSLKSNQRQLTSVHGPMAPVTFNNEGCNDTYDHGHSVSAPASPCNKAPLQIPVIAEAPKIAAATAAAEGDAVAKEGAAAAKEVAEAQEASKPKEAGAPEAAKTEAESAAPAAPAKAALLELDGPIEPVTFEDSHKCTQTYDHSHSVSGVPEVVCGPGSKESAVAADGAKNDKTKKKDAASEASKDNRDAKANEAAAAKAAAKADKTPKSGKPKKTALAQIDESGMPTPTFHDDNNCKYTYNSPNGELMQPDPECPLLPKDKKGDPLTKPQGPAPAQSLSQGLPDPQFKDKNKCVHKYVSPNSDLMQPDPECPGDAKQEQGTHAPKAAPKAAALSQIHGGPPPIIYSDSEGEKKEYDLGHHPKAWTAPPKEEKKEDPADTDDKTAQAKALQEEKKAPKDTSEPIKVKGEPEQKEEAKEEAKEAPKKAKDAAKKEKAPAAKEEAKAPAALVQINGPAPVMVTDSRGAKSEYDLSHDMTAHGALNKDLDAPGTAGEEKRSVESAEQNAAIVKGIKAKEDAGIPAPEKVKKAGEGGLETAKPKKEEAKEAPEAPAAKALVMGPEPVTYKDSRGISQVYDTTHDMTKDGALNVDVPDAAADKKILKAAAAEKAQADGIKAKAAAGEAAPAKGKKAKPAEGAKEAAPAAKEEAKAPEAPAAKALIMIEGPAPVTFRDSRGFDQTYDTTHDMTKDGALNVDVPDAAADKKALKAAAAEKAQADGIKAKAAAGEAAPAKGKKAKPAEGAKEAAPAAKEEAKAPAKEEAKAPPAAALVGDMPPATFRDSNKCLHTYSSPRKVEDFGIDQDAECEEGKVEQQSLSKPKPEEVVKPASETSIQAQGEPAKEGPKVKAIEEQKATAKLDKGPEPAAVALVQEPTFYDTAKCRHSYSSPRVLGEGFDDLPECPQGVTQQASTHAPVPKDVEKKLKKKVAKKDQADQAAQKIMDAEMKQSTPK